MRVVSWFSCGAPSAVAAKLAIRKYGDDCVVVNCFTMPSEHIDNVRFFREVSCWLGRPIKITASPKYVTIDDVFEQTRFMAGPRGARCTVEMKKVPRFNFQLSDDVHVFGYTADESGRVEQFKTQNPELNIDDILGEHHLTKAMCIEIIERTGIEIPAMYKLGYRNNNCIGCVKATSARYWNMIRRDFPRVFELRCQQSRELGVRLTRVEGVRVFLDELPQSYMSDGLENVSCGPECNTLL